MFLARKIHHVRYGVRATATIIMERVYLVPPLSGTSKEERSMDRDTNM